MTQGLPLPPARSKKSGRVSPSYCSTATARGPILLTGPKLRPPSIVLANVRPSKSAGKGHQSRPSQGRTGCQPPVVARAEQATTPSTSSRPLWAGARPRPPAAARAGQARGQESSCRPMSMAPQKSIDRQPPAATDTEAGDARSGTGEARSGCPTTHPRRLHGPRC